MNREIKHVTFFLLFPCLFFLAFSCGKDRKAEQQRKESEEIKVRISNAIETINKLNNKELNEKETKALSKDTEDFLKTDNALWEASSDLNKYKLASLDQVIAEFKNKEKNIPLTREIYAFLLKKVAIYGEERSYRALIEVAKDDSTPSSLKRRILQFLARIKKADALDLFLFNLSRDVDDPLFKTCQEFILDFGNMGVARLLDIMAHANQGTYQKLEVTLPFQANIIETLWSIYQRTKFKDLAGNIHWRNMLIYQFPNNAELTCRIHYLAIKASYLSADVEILPRLVVLYDSEECPDHRQELADIIRLMSYL